ncbi:MAG TPA: hypothetical protein VGM10_21150 [Actinocrinis sp.]|jgi:hypothetical protein
MGDVAPLVRSFLERGERWSPVLVLTGPRRCGKTWALDRLAEQLNGNVPYMHVDCVTVHGGARELLTKLAFDLNLHNGAYESLSFPRLLTGLVVIAAELDLATPALARAQVRRALEDVRDLDKLREAVKRIAADAVAVIPAAKNVPGMDTVAQYGPELLLKGLLATRKGRKALLGPGEDWYGHQDLALRLDPLHVLVDLNRFASRPDVEGDRRRVTELLWAAFLADLSASFEGQKGWNLTCAVLIDNADCDTGLDFLEELTAARTRRVDRAAHRPDPLTVVATSRGRLVTRVVRSAAGVAESAAAGHEHYQRLREANLVESGWYPVRLPELTETEVRTLVSGLGLRDANDELLARMLHRFTRGHAGATHLLVRALATAEEPGHLAALLGQPEPGVLRGGVSVGERLRRDLVGKAGPAVLRDLVVCSAARTLADASQLALAGNLLTTPRGSRQNEVFPVDLWGAEGDGPVVMLPVLRSLLIRELVERPEDWRAALQWLEANSAETEDTEAELYYALALGKGGEVARRLAERLATVTSAADADGWLHLLHAVTAAPCASTQDVWPDPTGLPALIAAVDRLVTALWLAGNCVRAEDLRGLYQEAAVNLDEIAPHAKGGWMTLRAQAEKYRRVSAAS